MNATTKKAGSTRAVFAIEEAIADTRQRIAGTVSADLKKTAQAALARGPRLQTEKDGRLFAMAALERLDKADANEAAAYPHFSGPAYDIEDTKPFRKGAQWDGLYRDLSRLLDASEEARRGFASIFTEVLAADICVDSSYFRELERAGKFKPFGTPGTAYPAPKVLPKSKAMLKAERKHKAEQKARAKEEIDRAAALATLRAIADAQRKRKARG